MGFNEAYGQQYMSHSSRTKFDSSQFDSLFKDTPYWDTYQGILSQYAKGPEAAFLGNVTGANAKNAYNHNQSRMNAINALLEQKRTDEYNSPEQQAARERAAGLNPDITGLSDVGATDSASTPNEKDMLYENPLPHIGVFIQNVASAAVSAQSLIAGRLNNNRLRLENFNLSKGIILDELADHDHVVYTNSTPDFKLYQSTGSRSLDRQLTRNARNMFTTSAHEVAYRERLRNIAKLRKEKFDIESSPGYSYDDDFYSGLATRLAKMYQSMLDITNKYEKERISELNGSTAGKVEYEKNNRSYLNHRFWNEAMGLEHGMIKYIKDMAAKGDPAAIDTLLNLMGDNSSFGGAFQKNTLPLSWTVGAYSPFNK